MQLNIFTSNFFVINDYWSNRSSNERICEHSHEQIKNTNYSFYKATATNVTITDCTDGSEGVVDSCHVKLARIQVLKAIRNNPTKPFFLGIIWQTSSNKNPNATKNMTHNEQNGTKET